MIYRNLTTRRALLKTGGALVAGAGLARGAEAVVGMIVPRKVPTPPEAGAMYPSGVAFLTEGVGLDLMTPAGYNSVIDRIVPTAKELAKQGAQGIALMGTSLSFYKGAAFNQQLADSIHQATGLPSTTMSTAVVEGLRAVGGKRLAVATAYNEEVSELLRVFLQESGFEVLVVKGLGIEKIGVAGTVSQDDLHKFVIGVAEKAQKADAMLVSCGGLRTLELIAPLEKDCKMPVVSSMPHALRAAVRLVGLKGTAPGFGTLLSKG
jgi:arylmalonate decarboxylase